MKSKRRSTFRTLLRRAGPPAALLIVGLFFGGYAVLGPNGALAYGDIKRQLAQREVELAALDLHRAELRNRVDLLDPAPCRSRPGRRTGAQGPQCRAPGRGHRPAQDENSARRAGWRFAD